jgi:hypothetical protein
VHAPTTRANASSARSQMGRRVTGRNRSRRERPRVSDRRTIALRPCTRTGRTGEAT